MMEFPEANVKEKNLENMVNRTPEHSRIRNAIGMLAIYAITTLTSLFSFNADAKAIDVQGQVTNKKGVPVENAEVKITSLEDSLKAYIDTTDILGDYFIHIPEVGAEEPFKELGKFELKSYPNPFRGGTTIKYSLPKDANVSMHLFNIAGQCVDEIVNEDMKAGSYEIPIGNIPAGVNFLTVKAGNSSETIKLISLSGNHARGYSTSRNQANPEESADFKTLKSGKEDPNFQVDISNGVIATYTDSAKFVSDTTYDAEVNLIPVYTGALEDTSLPEGEKLEINLNNHFTDDEPLVYSSNAPQISIDDSIATLQFEHGDTTLTYVRFTATDQSDSGLEAVSDPITIAYVEVDDLPQINLPDSLIWNESCPENSDSLMIILTQYASDEETPDSLLVFNYSGNTNIAVNIQDSIATLKAPDNWSGLENIAFSVEDSAGQTAKDTVTAKVKDIYRLVEVYMTDLFSQMDAGTTAVENVEVIMESYPYATTVCTTFTNADGYSKLNLENLADTLWKLTASKGGYYERTAYKTVKDDIVINEDLADTTKLPAYYCDYVLRNNPSQWTRTWGGQAKFLIDTMTVYGDLTTSIMTQEHIDSCKSFIKTHAGRYTRGLMSGDDKWITVGDYPEETTIEDSLYVFRLNKNLPGSGTCGCWPDNPDSKEITAVLVEFQPYSTGSGLKKVIAHEGITGFIDGGRTHGDGWEYKTIMDGSTHLDTLSNIDWCGGWLDYDPKRKTNKEPDKQLPP